MSKRALVVDNDYFFVEFLSELLTDKGFEVVKAYDGKEAMVKLETETVDLMFADIVMPKVDGWQLIQYVRRRFAETPFPVVAVSGTIVEQLDELEQIGADFYIIKGPLEKMKLQIAKFLDDLKMDRFEAPEEKLIYDPGNIYPRRESAELIESLQFQKAIFQSIGLGMIVIDQDGKIMLVNEQALEIFGQQAVDMLNQPAPQIFPPAGRKRLVDVMRKVVRSPDLKGVTFSTMIEDGRVRMVVSLLRVEGRQAGWIFAIEGVDA